MKKLFNTKFIHRHLFVSVVLNLPLFKLSLFSLFLLFTHTLGGQSNLKPWLTSLEVGMQLAQKKNRPILLDLYVPWCHFCRKLQRETYPKLRRNKTFNEFIRVRINGEKQPQILEDYEVRSFPTIIFLDKNGAYLHRINGFVNTATLANKLKEAYKLTNKQEVILAELAKKPSSPHWNFAAGDYYFQIKDYKKSRQYFLTAWKKSLQSKADSKKLQKQRKALYNTAISSMLLDNYDAAVYEWSLYLKHYPKHNRDYVYARYYRGLSFYHKGNQKAAVADLKFARQYLTNPQDKYTVKTLLE